MSALSKCIEALEAAKRIATDCHGPCAECEDTATGFSFDEPSAHEEPMATMSCDAHADGEREEYPTAKDVRIIKAALTAACAEAPEVDRLRERVKVLEGALLTYVLDDEWAYGVGYTERSHAGRAALAGKADGDGE